MQCQAPDGFNFNECRVSTIKSSKSLRIMPEYKQLKKTANTCSRVFLSFIISLLLPLSPEYISHFNWLKCHLGLWKNQNLFSYCTQFSCQKNSHFCVFLVTVYNFPIWKHKSLCAIVHGGRKAVFRTSGSEKEIQVLILRCQAISYRMRSIWYSLHVHVNTYRGYQIFATRGTVFFFKVQACSML